MKKQKKVIIDIDRSGNITKKQFNKMVKEMIKFVNSIPNDVFIKAMVGK